jgi:hypothetical protein
MALAVLLAACDDTTTGPHVSAAWTGSDTARFTARAKVSWCPVARRLEVLAVRNDDLGFGLVVYPVNEIEPGEFPAVDPGADTVRRPSVAAAARKFTETNILALQSDSGSLVLTKEGESFGVRFGFRLKSPDEANTVVVTGEATGLVPGPCIADSVPAAAPVQ